MEKPAQPFSIGKIEGETSTESFQIIINAEGVGKNDYLEISHEGRAHLAVIKDMRRTGDRTIGECIVIGTPPKTPFVPGSDVFHASEQSVRSCLGLETKESEGTYLGKLKSMNLNVWLPIKKLTRIFVVGKPGAGKSYTMGVLAEELIKKGIPLVIIDAHGEYSSLKVPAESSSQEFHVEPHSYSEQIIEFADIAFNPGADIDLSAIDNSRPEDIVSQMQCTIINLRGITSSEQYLIVNRLLTKLLDAVMVMQIPPFYMALDEAHLFAGRNKKDDPNARLTLDVVRRFAQEGRKFGANLIVLTQRPQLLDMTVRSLSATWIIHRLTDPNDIRIAIESGGLDKGWEYDVSWLESGHAIITGDVVERVPLVIKVRHRETTHGAPGFNPLDFVSPEEREKMKRRMAQLKDRLMKMRQQPGSPPTLPPSLPALYMPVRIDEKQVSDTMKEIKSLDRVEVLKSELKFLPSLFCEVSILSARKSPDIEFKERLRRIVPADSSVSLIDWRHESAYSLVPGEILDYPPAPSPTRQGHHEAISPYLVNEAGVENIKGPLKAFTASKLTQTIYYHQELGEYSKPGELLEAFKIRLGEKLNEMKASKVTLLKQEYSQKLQAVKGSISVAKDECDSVEKLVDEIKAEMRSLEKEKKRAESEEKSTLKVSSQIQTRESRLMRLEKRMAELREKISVQRRSEDTIERSLKHDVASIEKELDKLIDLPLQSIIFQPKMEEVDVQALQLIWIPYLEVLMRVSFKDISKDFKLQWNAVNGRGIFGACTECGTTIEDLEGGTFCYTCGNMYCDSHLKLCSACGRSACTEHIWTCPECGKTFCLDEPPKKCAVCGKKICPDCAGECVNCDGKNYCKDHLKVCSPCKRSYCPEHYASHVAYCKKCGKELCIIEQVSCTICDGVFCEEHVAKCSICHEEICKDDSWLCSACGRMLCSNEIRHKCKICSRTFCPSCVERCNVCGEDICKEHMKTCPSCIKPTCPNCMVEQKRLGIFKKVVCKRCSLK